MGKSPSRAGPRLAHDRVRVYESLRSAHLERAAQLEPASIVYLGRNYDFDPALANGLDLVRVEGPVELLRLLLREDVRELEVNEPLMLSAVKYGLVAAAAARCSRLLGRPVRLVSYAIENGHPLESSSRRLRSPWRRRVYRLAVRVLLRQLDRIAFGTVAAERDYRRLGLAPRTRTALVPALSAPCSCAVGASGPSAPEVVFLGAFDERKGLRSLLEVWPQVSGAVPGVRLRVLGKGPLEDELRALVVGRDDVVWEIDPGRAAIHEHLRAAKVLVLWSQPSAAWREQVGLPLVEGLAHGCLVVASEQTGIADWLADHGHEVVDTTAPLDQLAAAVARSLTSSRGAGSVLADLPAEDGRLAADRWLFGR